MPTIPLVLDDMHDGDQKQIQRIEWNTFVIQPYPNTSAWRVDGQFDINCVAFLDFNVTGKTDYPPVPLKMSMWIMESIAYPSAVKLAFEFTDPSETLAPQTQPLNTWLSPVLTGPEQPSVVPLEVSLHSSSASRLGGRAARRPATPALAGCSLAAATTPAPDLAAARPGSACCAPRT